MRLVEFLKIVAKIWTELFKGIQYLKLSIGGIEVGKNTYISRQAYIDKHPGSKISIGRNCYITRNVVILNHTDTCRGGPEGMWIKYGGRRISKDVVIGDNVFIGVNSVILPGINIGDNAVIGALSLVNRDIPANTVWAGVPVKYISDLEQMIKNEIVDFEGV